MRPTLLAFLAFATFAHGQDTQLPTVDDVKSLRVKFEEERAAALKAGADKRFMPGLVDRATAMANKAEAAREAGRLLQASEFYRQARWQLPYLSPKLPEHVSRVLGNFRLRHGMDITCVAYSPDGKYLASGSRDRFVKIWDLANGRETVAYAGHADVIHALAFSPDGKAVASSGNGPEIRLWSPEDGKEIRKFDGSGKDVKAIAFSKDGKYLISGQTSKAGGSGGIVAVHEVATGKLKREVRDFGNLVSCVAFNAKGNILAVGVGTGLLRLYEFPKMVDQPDQPEYWTHQDNYGGTYDIAFSPDDRLLIRTGADGIKIYPLVQPGAAFQAAAPLRTLGNLGGIRYTVCHVSANSKTLFAGDSAGTLRSFDLETGQLIGELKGHTGEIRNMAMQPRGGQLATAGSDYMIRLWDFDVVMQARDFVGHEGPVWSAAFSPDGRRVVSASADQTLRVWDVLDAASVRVLKGHGGPVTMALFTPDGKKIISAGVDRTIKIWDAETGNITQELTGHIGTITALAVSDDGKLIVSGGADRMVKAWDVASGKVLLSVAGHDAVVAAVAIHPDGKRIAVGSVDPSIRIYDLDGKLLHRWSGHGIAVSGLAFSPNGQALASCGADGIAHVWPLASPGRNPMTLRGHVGPLSGVAFRKDSAHLLTCGADLTVKLWKLEGETAKELQSYRGHRDWVASVAFSRDGFYVVSASVDRTVKFWEITNKDLPLLPEHAGSVEAVAISPDGKWIASSGTDKTIKIWDRATGEEKATIRGHSEQIVSLVFSRDGKALFSNGHDRCIRVWDVATGREQPSSATRQSNWIGMSKPASMLATSGDGKTLFVTLSGDKSMTTYAYDFEGNSLFDPPLRDHGRPVQSLCFSGDGKVFATGAEDGSVRLWNLRTRQQLPGGDWFAFDKDTAVADLGLNQDGSSIIITSAKGDILIADVAKREVRKKLKGHADKIRGVVISGDGKRFATFDALDIVKLWDTASGEELRRWDLGPILANRAPCVAGFAITPDGKQIVVGNSNTTLFLLDAP